MRFAETNTRRGKGVRACSLLMSILIMCSMLFVGQVGTIEASAAVKNSGDTIYVDISNVSWWRDSGYEVAIYWWGTGGSAGGTWFMKPFNENIFMYTFDGTCNGFIIGRASAENSSKFNLFQPTGDTNSNKTADITSLNGNNCIRLENSVTTDGNRYRSYTATTYTFPTGSNTISQNNKMYVNVANSDWATSKENPCYGVWYWGSDGNGYYQQLTAEGGTSGSYGTYFSFTPNFDVVGFRLIVPSYQLPSGEYCPFAVRKTDVVSDGSSQQDGDFKPVKYCTNDVTDWDGSNDCITIGNRTDSGTAFPYHYGYSWGNCSAVSINSRTEMNAAVGFASNNSVTGIDVTFFDYLTDNELMYGWRSNDCDLQASRSYLHREPFTKLNQYISSKVEEYNWAYPMYFGNFYLYKTAYDESTSAKYSDAWDYSAYKGMTGDLLNFAQFVNDSTVLLNSIEQGGAGLTYAATVAGLVDDTLITNNIAVNGEVLPYFSDELANAGLAQKISTSFPMRIVTDRKATKYEFDSVEDVVYFTGSQFDNNSNNLTIQYSADQANYGIYDANRTMGGQNTDGFGFFPFDRTNDNKKGTVKTSGDDTGTEQDNAALDYGFGMKLEYTFGVGKGGLDANGDPMTFEFTGDDDLWVFVDGKLVLDMGGAHGKASGKIDFSTKKSTVTSGTVTLSNNPSSSSSEMSAANAKSEIDFSSWFDNQDPTTPHTMTIFYMERGMVESNLKMSFSVVPLSNSLSTHKTVKVEGVNAQLTSDVTAAAQKEDFTFTYTENSINVGSNKTYIDKADTTGEEKNLSAEGSTTLKHNGGISFIGQFGTGNQVSITESYSGGYSYSPSYVVTNQKTDETIASGNGSKADFQFGDSSTSTSAIYDVTFTNTIKVADLTLSKKLTGASGVSEKYPFKVEVCLPGLDSTMATNWKVYDYDGSGTKFDGYGKVSLAANESIKIEGLPIGTQVRITEELGDITNQESNYNYTIGDVKVDGTSKGVAVTQTVTISDSGNMVEYTNKKESNSIPVSPIIEATKTIDSKNLSGITDNTIDKTFTFTLTKLTATNKKSTAESDIVSTDNDATTGNIKFTLSETTQNAKYILTETSNSDYFVKNNTEYYVEVEVDATTGSYKVNYYNAICSNSDNSYSKGNDLVATYTYANGSGSYNNSTKAKFNNTTHSLTVIKRISDSTKTDGYYIPTDMAGKFEFTLVKADNNWLKSTGANAWSDNKSIDESGKATFEYLAEGNYLLYESKTADGYELEGEVHKIKVTDEGRFYEVKSDGREIELTAVSKSPYPITNQKSTDLPETGGMGVVVFVVVGVVLIVAAVLLLKPKKDKTNPSDKQQ